VTTGQAWKERMYQNPYSATDYNRAAGRARAQTDTNDILRAVAPWYAAIAAVTVVLVVVIRVVL